MSRKPSPETELKTIKRLLKETEHARNRYLSESNQFRQLLSKSQGETEEWKRRFDLLLARTPSTSGAVTK